MPTAPKRFTPLRLPRYRRQSQRPNAAKRGYCSNAWKQTRLAFLAANPICCEPDCHQPATEVDHRHGTSGPDIDPAFYTGPFDAYCKRHHSAKTARENHGFGNRKLK